MSLQSHAQGDLCQAGRLQLAVLTSCLMRVASNEWSRCHVRKVSLCCTARRICSQADQPHLAILLGRRKIRHGEAEAITANAIRSRQSLFDARHHGRSRFVCILVFSQTMLGNSAVVNRLCYSRPRSLDTLKSINLTKKIREIIEGGPPKDLVQTFQTLFSEKIERTHQIAREAAVQYCLLQELC